MIVRVWRAQATVEGAEQYRAFFERTRLPMLRRVAGFQRAYLLTRPHDEGVALEVQTFWESLDAVRTFAGANVDAAVVEPEVQAMLTGYDTTTLFFDVREYGA